MNARAGQFHVHRIGGLVSPARAPFSHDDRTLAWDARLATEAPRVPWDVFTRDIFDWREGEHVGLIAPTGQGKTTVLTYLLPFHPYVVVFATKPRDVSMDRLIATGYDRMDRWANIPVDRSPRRVLWPSAAEIDSATAQAAVFRDAMARIYREHGWTVVIDEGWVFINEFKMSHEVKTFLLQGRSLGISLIFATQRPVDVPLEVYDQSTHLFFGRDNDERNLSRLSGISWRSADLIRNVVANLDQYQMLYINTRTGEMARTRVPGPVAIPDNVRGG